MLGDILDTILDHLPVAKREAVKRATKEFLRETAQEAIEDKLLPHPKRREFEPFDRSLYNEGIWANLFVGSLFGLMIGALPFIWSVLGALFSSRFTDIFSFYYVGQWALVAIGLAFVGAFTMLSLYSTKILDGRTSNKRRHLIMWIIAFGAPFLAGAFLQRTAPSITHAFEGFADGQVGLR